MDCLEKIYPPEVYCMLYYANICHVCKTPSKDLKRCSRCKMLSYCSKKHQLLDWPIHKQLCKVIVDSNKILLQNCQKVNIALNNIRNLQHFRGILWTRFLGRKLERYEKNMLQFPKICAVCNKDNITITCENCWNVSYCTKEHQKQHRNKHDRYCTQLKLSMDLDIKYLDYHLDRDTEKLFQEQNPWIIGHYEFCIPDNIQHFPSDLKSVIDCFNVKYESVEGLKDIYKLFELDTICVASLILYCLEILGVITDRSFISSKLTVHLVGADFTEVTFYWDLIIKFYTKWLKNITELKFYVIGPEVKPYTFNVNIACIEFIGDVYHNVIEKIDKPDVVVSYNNGIHEYYGESIDTWKGSLKSLFKYDNVPLILTAYTKQEIDKDVDIVKNVTQAKVLVGPDENPFKSLKPVRNHDDDGDTTVFYKNYYYCVLKSFDR
ncbi:unnamed protein product [Acanthoscelides obtectus]|uniref:MYND-type domain-containing protein n=1 Tax=Acanthoscelides obtectus TaxID=200917 RepID=A0A9P0NW23_ACAOB|nr:unnamed protein product [Acanthoscelides obtectus]CAK1668038.1 hypothetical protein AOBTE_LOCUS26191 [Acanthoscelides obtectus]